MCKHTSKIYVFGNMSGIIKSSAPRLSCFALQPKAVPVECHLFKQSIQLLPALAGTIRQDTGPTFRTETASFQSKLPET